ncbi:nitrilase-related carbon-nitrogen hydrolase [Actinoplanes sp. NPDC051411]|uniref:nitrilase-related carbon-nitrogen hydrolase n=1 Tax=Actinoplanes sp. NPDC051411 TaxID=3155522 RepID=UPI00342F29DA
MEWRPRTGERRLWAAAALACSAVLGYLGTGLAPIAALTWLAPLPVLLLAPRVPARTALGVAFGAYLLGTANSWAFQLHSHDEPMVPVGLTINIGMSLTFVLTVWLFRSLAGRGRALLAAVAPAAAWTGVLYLVATVNPHGLMGTFANDQGDRPLVLQATAVAGMWAVEFLVMFAPCVVAALLAPAAPRAARLRTAAVGVLTFGAVLGFGILGLRGTAGPPQRVAAIAPNRYAWAPPVSDGLVAGYVREIENLPEGVRTVVLPEAAFGSDEADPAALTQPMRQVARARGVDIVLGFVQAPAQGRGVDNVALIFPADGGSPARYLKQHDLVSRPGHDLVFAPRTRTGAEICADVDFARPSRDYGAAGTSLLAIPASDNGGNGWQHSRAALLRGVENGLPVVWAAQNGTLMISDGRGRVLAQARSEGPARFTTITADVTGPVATFYSRHGDWFAWLCLAAALSGLIAALPATRRRAGTRRSPDKAAASGGRQ